MKAALNARPPKTLPKAKNGKKLNLQKVFSAFGKGIDRVEKMVRNTFGAGKETKYII